MTGSQICAMVAALLPDAKTAIAIRAEIAFFAEEASRRFVDLGLEPLFTESITNHENVPVEKAGFSCRAYNALKNHGVDTLGQLSMQNTKILRGWSNCGSKTKREFAEKLDEYSIPHVLPRK